MATKERTGKTYAKTLKVGGKPVSTVGSAVAGAAAGYKMARGVGAVTGTLAVASGLTSIIAVTATLKDDAALAGSIVSATWTGANITLKVWKPTSSSDGTLIAATAAKNVSWIAIGT